MSIAIDYFNHIIHVNRKQASTVNCDWSKATHEHNHRYRTQLDTSDQIRSDQMIGQRFCPLNGAYNFSLLMLFFFISSNNFHHHQAHLNGNFR